MRMMFNVVAAKSHRRRETIGQIGENGGPFIGQRAFEHAIVNGVMESLKYYRNYKLGLVELVSFYGAGLISKNKK